MVLSYSKLGEGGVGETLFKWKNARIRGREENQFQPVPISPQESSPPHTDRLSGLRMYPFTEDS